MPGREASILVGLPEDTFSTLCFRSIQPEDKSFAVGIQFMLLRVLGKLNCVKIPSWKIMAALGEGFPKAGKDAALQGLGVLVLGMRQSCSKGSISMCKGGLGILQVQELRLCADTALFPSSTSGGLQTLSCDPTSYFSKGENSRCPGGPQAVPQQPWEGAINAQCAEEGGWNGLPRGLVGSPPLRCSGGTWLWHLGAWIWAVAPGDVDLG